MTNPAAGTAHFSAFSQSHKRYAHSLRLAYRAMGLTSCFSNEELHIPCASELHGLSKHEILDIAVEGMRKRLAAANPDLLAEFIGKPFLKMMTFNGRKVFIPIVNNEGVSWYSNSPMLNFDFLVESFHGMHRDARVIYDIGGHQGVWALYYATCIPTDGRVYSFEPSIINIEIAALSFLINDINNVNIVPAGIGQDNVQIKSIDDGLLISGSSHTINLMKLDWVMLEAPDFIKIDIEGYEHELIAYMPDIFDFCDNIHLEIHVPHLAARGINYRDIFERIPFDRLDVHLSVWGSLTKIDRAHELTEFSTLLITTRH